MSTASQRRKAKRLALQAPFAEKVREVALSLPRRKPEPANGMMYVKRIESGPLMDAIRDDIGSRRFRIVDLSEASGGKPHRRFVIPFGEPTEWYRLDRAPSHFSPMARYLEFTWRSWAVRAGDTEVRWYAPELLGPGAPEEGSHAFGAARKACAYISKAIAALDFSARDSWLARDMREAQEALLEFIGEMDPDSTRAQREAETSREARAAHR